MLADDELDLFFLLLFFMAEYCRHLVCQEKDLDLWGEKLVGLRVCGKGLDALQLVFGINDIIK